MFIVKKRKLPDVKIYIYILKILTRYTSYIYIHILRYIFIVLLMNIEWL